MSLLENIEVEPSRPAAKVVVNARTGTIVIGGDVRVTPAAVTHGSLTVKIDEKKKVTATGGAIVTLTAAGLTSSIGDASQETSYEAPSVSMTSTVGSVNIRTDVVFTITGVSATSSVGNLQGTFWSQVDDSNSDISWTEVHKAA